MLLVDDLAAGGTKNLRHTPRGLVTLKKPSVLVLIANAQKSSLSDHVGVSSAYWVLIVGIEASSTSRLKL